MKDAGNVARKELDATAPIVPGPDKRFSNFKRAGKLGVKVRADSSGVTVSPRGPWGIAERGAAPHTMPAWGRGQAKHPGTRAKQGRQAWTKGRLAAFRVLEKQVPDRIAREVERGFDRG